MTKRLTAMLCALIISLMTATAFAAEDSFRRDPTVLIKGWQQIAVQDVILDDANADDTFLADALTYELFRIGEDKLDKLTYEPLRSEAQAGDLADEPLRSEEQAGDIADEPLRSEAQAGDLAYRQGGADGTLPDAYLIAEVKRYEKNRYWMEPSSASVEQRYTHSESYRDREGNERTRYITRIETEVVDSPPQYTYRSFVHVKLTVIGRGYDRPAIVYEAIDDDNKSPIDIYRDIVKDFYKKWKKEMKK